MRMWRIFCRLGEKMEVKKELEIMNNFSKYIQVAIKKSALEAELEKEKLLLMHSAVLLKAAVELYTTVFDDDDMIENILYNAIKSISTVRKGPNPGIKSDTLH